ncbi:MAG: DUF3820 family protein [Saccharospirillum sp.]
MTFKSSDLVELANTSMPFGKYRGQSLIRLPEPYLLWFQQKGWPPGRLGQLMALALLIRSEGLEHLIRPLKGKRIDG